MIRLFSIVFVCLCFCAAADAKNAVSERTVITGSEMEIRKAGEETVSRGKSKAVNGKNTVESDVMTYDKKNDSVQASGNVRISSKTDDDEPVKATGRYATYNLSDGKGSLWGENAIIKYYMKSSESPLILSAKKINVDRNLETLSAYKDVEIITSSGTIISDNAVYDKKEESVTMVKDERRPLADVLYDGRKGVYEADTMVFFNADSKKKIIMNGDVKGVIEMEDKIE